MSPAYPQQQPKKSHTVLWIVLGVVGALLIICIGGVALLGLGLFTVARTVVNSINSTQTAEAVHHQVGQTVTTATWQVTINSVATEQSDPNELAPTPAPGDTFLVIEATFKNISSGNQALSTLVDFELRDSAGNKYDEALLPSLLAPDGTVPSGAPAHGKWGYEVPTSMKAYTLTFSDDLGGTTTLWDIMLPTL